MGDNHGGAAAAAVPAFSVAPYVLLIVYLALVLVPFANLLDVLACLHVVKLTSAYLLLTSVIKLTRKLLNILTALRFYFPFLFFRYLHHHGIFPFL
jgi:chromate transport protein ChrA